MYEITLDAVNVGERAKIAKNAASGAMGRRLLDLGFTEGAEVRHLFDAVSGSPMAFLIRGTVIALRRDDAAGIVVRKESADGSYT